MLAMSTAICLQCWKDGQPIDTIIKQPNKPLPDVDALNAKIPESEWEPGLDEKPRPPWQKEFIVYLVNPTDASIYTFINSTMGAQIAFDRLKSKVVLMRQMRGANVVPIVKLDSQAMKTKFGQKIRPEFTILEWRQLGSAEGKDANPAGSIEHQGGRKSPASAGRSKKCPTTSGSRTKFRTDPTSNSAAPNVSGAFPQQGHRVSSDWQPLTELPDLRRVGIIALDTETNDDGLRADRGSAWPWRGGYVCGVSVAYRADGGIRSHYFPLRHPETSQFRSRAGLSLAAGSGRVRRALRHPERPLRLGLAARRWRCPDAACRSPRGDRRARHPRRREPL